MTKEREALKLSLEALEDRSSLMKWQEARDAVKEALAQPEQFCDANCVWTDHHPDCKLAQPEQEPVAYLTRRKIGGTEGLLRADMVDRSAKNQETHDFIPLYTTPPQRTERPVDCERCNRLEEQAYDLVGKLRVANIKLSMQPQRTEQEPVAYLCENAVGHKYFRWKKPSSTYKPIALYTTPPQRPWVGLTDEDKKQMFKEANYHWEMTAGEYAERIGQLTEAKLKERNT